MVTYTLNNVNYTYTVGVVDASVGSSSSATDDISLLSSFVVDGDTYNVTSIAASAFYGATNLTSVTIPTSVTVINESTFEGCTNLTTVNIPSATTIGVNAFYGCSSLTSITFPDTLNTISTNAFYGCSSLTSVTIPATVTNILENPFRNCISLSSITVDADNTFFLSENGVLFDKLKQILILYPSKLLNTSYVIPSTVESINSYAFSNCENLRTVMIPSLVSLNDSTFNNCSNLLNVIFTGIVPTINGNNFEATLDTAVYDSAKNPTNVLNRLSMFTNTINQPTPTLTNFTLPSYTFSSVPFVITPPTSDVSGVVITYTSSNSAISTISGNMLTLVTVDNGTSYITATQTFTNFYGDLSFTTFTSVDSNELYIYQATPSLSFSVPSKTFGDVSFNLVTPTSDSDGAFTYTSSDISVATIDGNTVTVVGAGTATITASQASTTNFLTDSITESLVVNKATPVLTDFSVPAKTFGDESFNLVAPTSNSDGAFTYTSSDTTVATIDDSMVTIVGGGSSTITAVQESTANFLTSSITTTLVVSQATPVLIDFSVPAKTFGDVSFNLVAPTSNSDGLFTYTSSNTAVATIDGSMVTIIGVGTSTITAVQASTANFLTSSITTTLTVNQATPTITNFSVPSKTFGDVSFNLVAPTSNSSGAFTYTSSDTTVATISGSKITIVGGGTATITANQASTANYTSGTIPATLTVNPATTILSNFYVPAKSISTAPFTLSPPTTNTNGTFTYTSSDPTVATIDGSMVTIIGLGTTSITAVQSSTVNFTSASITETLTIMNQVPISIGVGSGGNTIASSTDLGLIWTGRGATTFTTAGYGVAGPATYADPSLNGTLMISLSSSTNSSCVLVDGFFKNGFPSTLPIDITTARNVVYGNGIWVIGAYNTTGGNTIAISSDGVTWTGKVLVSSGNYLNTLTYANNLWVAGVVIGSSPAIIYSSNNWATTTSISNTIPHIWFNNISFAHGYWFTNYLNRIYSTDDSNITSNFINRNNAIIFNQNHLIPKKFVAGKDNLGANLIITIAGGYHTNATPGNTIAKSPNGSTWTNVPNTLFNYYGSYPLDLAYGKDGSGNEIWMISGIIYPNGQYGGTNGIIATSYDGTNWTKIFSFPNGDYAGSIKWTGTEWYAASSVAIIKSTDGINWTNTANLVSGSNYFELGPVVTYTKPTFIAVGQGGNTMATSNNGTTWKGEGSGIFTTAGYGIAWNGKQWVAVGSGRNNIAYSSDGILWTGNSTQTFSTQGNDVAYGKDISGNGLWVVAGQGVNSIATSSDGLTWTGRGTTVFTTAGWCVAFGKDGSGNRLLVAVGQGTNTIATSTNGITWTGRGATIFTTKGIGVTYANNLWIAVGQGGNSIATSVNGINWTGLGSTIFTQGNGIRYTNNLWVATGTGANTIATSTNGTTWTGRGATIFTTAGQDVRGPTSVEPMMTFTVSPRYIEEAPFTITPPTSNSNGLFTYTSSNASVATIDGTTVTVVGPGITTISAFQASTEYYISGTIDASFTVNKLVTVLTDFSVPEKSIDNEAFTIIPPTSNSDSEATFIYTSSDTTVATIVGTTITIVGAGTTTITAFQASSARYASGTTTATFIVNKLITVLTDFSVPAKMFGDVSFNLIAPTINRDGAITYTSSNTAVATVSGSTVTIIGVGTSTITAFQASTPIYTSGTTTAPLVVNQATTVLSNFSVPTKTFGNAAFNIVAPTTNRNGAFTYTSSDTTVATISGTTITIVSGGTATITANQASTANYLAGTISATLIVNQATPTITNFVVPAKIMGDASFNLVNPTSNSSGLFTYTSSNTDVATIEGNVVTIIRNGIITITASQASTNKYISGSITGTLYVRLIPTITNFVIPTKTFGEVSYLYFPSPVSDSSGYYTFTSSNTTVASIYSNAVNEVNQITIGAGGTTTITAVQAMTDQYISGTITTTFTVNPATTVLSNFSVGSRTYGDYSNGNAMNFSAIPPTTNNNQGAFTYTSSNTSVATINQYIITIVGGGTTTITAVQASASNYTTASISAPFTVTPATGVLSNFSVPDKVVGDASFSITNPTSAKNYYALANTGAFTYTSSDLTVATIQGNVITVVGNGTSTITAVQAATANYTSASITATFRVRLTPTLSNFVIPAKVFGDADFTVTPPTTDSGGSFTYASSNTAIAYFYSGNFIKIVTTGTITVTATLYATNDYISKTITTTFTVNPATPVLSIFPNLTKYVGESFYITPPISNSPGAFTYTSSDTSVASISIINGFDFVTISQAGSTTITAVQAATAKYTATSITAILQTVKNPNNLTSFVIPVKQFGNAPFTLSNPTTNSSGAFTYTSSNTAVATIEGSTITIVGAGTSTITASQAATTNHFAGTTTATMTVSQATPIITIFDVPAKSIVTAPFSLVAPTSNSNGAFTYTSSNTSVATMDGSIVTIVGLGNTTITAVQAGTTNYLSASITGILDIMVNVPLSIAVGSGGNSIATSINRGLTWTGCGTSVFTSSGRCVAFGKDGSGNNLLVAVGSGGNTIATSTNGTTWIGRGVSVFTSQGLGVTYANNLWVAVGQGTNSIATSPDGVVWTGRTGTSIFSNQGTGVAFNNGLWVAVGDGTTNSIATSADGVVWTGRGKTNFSGWGRGIAYGNGLWVAIGQGTHSIATSPDGVVWTGRTGTSIFSNQGIGVAFNNGLWVAVGQGTTTTIATSTDGVNWTSRGKTTFSVLGHSVAFNSGLWVAVGEGTNSIATSPDGITWTGRGTSVFSTSGFGVAVGVITAPVISIISPSSGAIVGGTSVTITGTNFTGATSVTFGGLAATSISILNSTTITCITPARSAGAVGIIVTTEDGPSGEFSSFTYITPPSITGISQSSGSTEGGTNVTITGTSFIGATSVTFGGIAATSLSVVNSTTITCITPARSIGAAGIIVTTLYGTSSAFSSFTYITPPVISSISPLSGSTLEGTNVTIRGTNFTGATLVTFGELSATTINVVNSTTITCITPIRSVGAVDIIVTTGGGPSGAFSSFTYITPPVITDISPSSGSTLGGTNVTITGTNFTGATLVTFGGLAATTINVVNSTTITCITRDRSIGAGDVGIIVTTGGGPSGAFSSFTYITPPVISSILPLTGSTVGGTTVTITGTSFTGATLVTFSGLPATSLNIVNSTTITCIAPVRSTGAAGIIVKTLYGTSVAFSSFTYITPPSITGISPSSGGIAGGTNVTITGKNFTGATMVTFGGLSATNLSVVNSTTITCITPVRSAGAVGIIVTTGGGPSGAFSSFTYITPPIITSISQLTGSTAGGTNVTITGTHFTGATSVTFDGLAATTINVVNSTTITCITPAHITGVVGIIVTTVGGPSDAFSSFTYITPPVITDISSSSGSTLGGTNVTITGTNFTGATLVTFGGLSATTINVVNSTTITCITPARTTAGDVGIIVTTDGGPSSAFSSFTYITPPIITSISQLTGSTAGGMSVTITGTHFTGATMVTFDGLAATTINVVNSTTITCITPAHNAGLVGIIVTTGGGSSGAFSSFTYITSSVITDISPSSGSTIGGTSVTITGINFTGATSVTFDGIAATTINVVNSTTITCITPAHSDGAVGIIVTTGGGQSDAFSSFTYIIPSTITDISPSSGINTGGTSVTITGTNFTGATLVTFGGIAATTINLVNSTTITCITPAVPSDGAVGIIVTTGGGPSGAFSSFTYITSPVISSISPSSGGIAGGTSVTITGINFTGATSVTFDGLAATTINVLNSTTITCITPARTTAGAVDIIVTTEGGPSNTFASFTYITPPNITGILSSSGSTLGGTNVTITGTNFTGATSVTFDGLAATTINVVNSTTITCSTPAHSAGAVNVIVTTVGGPSGAFSSFTYITPPIITDISSSFGSTLGGTNVTITGTHFTGATSVTFDDLAATSINVVNSTTITCITPARTTAGAVGIIVTTQGGPSGAFSQFTYITPPNITSISQLTGSTTGGTNVTITGTNFTGATSVTFGGLAATSIDVVNSTTITCITPAHGAGAVNVIVTTGGGPSGAFSSFTYIMPPNITGILPLVGSTAGGTSVTITGTSFTGETNVTFDGLAATTINVVNSTTITCITPAHNAGAVGIIVTSEGRTSGAFSSFTYIIPPAITSISPSSGSTTGGTNATITGTNFTGATSVTFDGLAATTINVVNSTTITCITPAHITGVVGIIVTTGGGPSSEFSSFTYNTPPNITGISPLFGSTAGGTSVTITGTSFTGATMVTFGGITATSFNVVNSTTITCITPVRATAGAVGVVVITRGGPSNTFASFTYVLPPNIKSMLPVSVSRVGGTSVTITGTNFLGATSVTLGGLNATSFNVVSNTSITCITPEHTTGGTVGVIVTTGGGPSNTLSTFIYTPFVSAILPALGTRSGGTSVKITGVAFTGATSVTFGGIAATNVLIFNATTITCKTPASITAGAAGVVVTTRDGPSNTFSSFTYLTPPNITSISPSYGGTSGLTEVRITGQSFTGVSIVKFGDLKVKSLRVIDDTTIICVTAARTTPGPVDITVQNSIGISNTFSSFTYITTPKITSISPNFGSTTGGNTVTITGTDLTGATAVMVGDLSCATITELNSTTLTCITPARALPGPVGIIVTTGGGPSKKSSPFTYIVPPIISSISPSQGGTTGGNVVTITGLNFKGVTSVTFGGLNALLVKAVNPTTITCKTPVSLNAEAVDVIVITGGGPSNTFSSFTYIIPPVISDISPAAGNKAGGNSVTITGTNFTGATSVTFGKTVTTNITVVDNTTITCITPVNPAGVFGVIVRTGGGPSNIFASFTFVTPATISSILPVSGSTTGGTSVTIKGKNFTGATSVTFGGLDATSLTVVNDTLITCIAPARFDAGGVGIIVTTAGGPSTQFSFYNYITPPVITSISPSLGSITGGNVVTITGTSFTGARSVTFNGITATTIVVVNSTTITCKTPLSSSAGTGNIIVTTGGGPSNTFTDFTYVTPAVITSISPSSGPKVGGTSVTITGTNFTGASVVSFGAKAATNIIVVNDTTLTCVTPLSTPIAVSIIITTAGGLSNKFSSFTYK